MDHLNIHFKSIKSDQIITVRESFLLLFELENMIRVLLFDNHNANVRSALIVAQIAVIVDTTLVERVTNETVARRRRPSESVFDRL